MSETSELPSTRTWDGAASAQASKRAQDFEKAWKAARNERSRPDPRSFLPENPRERPAILLAVLRSELGLRYEAGERPSVEQYRERFPELDEDALVALIYEDFCLREEAGDAPVPVEYEERFPELVPRLRRVFDIHDLVGSGGSLALPTSGAPQIVFPEVGQTIAGFHLRAELGRGSFARVFLAEERQLADRPVALKVAKTGSREPQTLARLQHTHIVPVHSYRIDQATGLHLLCMPFFGRITLERLLAEPALRTSCTGADLLAVLDRLEKSGGSQAISTREAFASLPYARAVSWWGARMAEALAHAHERGVMHRDIKPSNVLITSEGLPMLLDFNLAREPWDEDDAKAPSGMLGGTLAYMAPEHLDAIAEGRDDKVDGRADLYSLGVLLFETLTGSRPFPPPSGGSSVGDALRRAAESRRGERPSIRTTHPEMPVALEAVILRCLEPDPARRHADAASLAADLEAVAQERPLPFTREPLSSRGRRWVSRNRFGLTLTVPLLILASMLLNLARQSQEDQGRIARQINDWVAEGAKLEEAGRTDAALAKYQDAARLASDQPLYQSQPLLLDGFKLATANRLRLKFQQEAESNASRFLSSADALRARLLDPSASATASAKLIQELRSLLAGYASVATQPDWTKAGGLEVLPRSIAGRLEREYEELLLSLAILTSRQGVAGRSEVLALCEVGQKQSRFPALWAAFADRYDSGRVSALPEIPAEMNEASARRLRSQVLLGLGDWKAAARELEIVERLEPGDFWCHRQMAGLKQRLTDDVGAARELDLALACRPGDSDTQRLRAEIAKSASR